MSNEKKCAHCGTTLSDLNTYKTVGCSDCYGVFRTEILALLHHEQGLEPSNTSIDKELPEFGFSDSSFLSIVSNESSDISLSPLALRSELEKQLADAVDQEEYEVAAKLRDQLSALKTTTSKV